MVALARAEARKALELLPSEPKAHGVLGGIAALHDYDWKEAEEQFRLARASEPVAPNVRRSVCPVLFVAVGTIRGSDPGAGESHCARPAERSVARASGLYIPLGRNVRTGDCRSAEGARPRRQQLYGLTMAIALSYFFQGKRAEAREQAEEAFRIAPWKLWLWDSWPAFWRKPVKRSGRRNCSQHSRGRGRQA